MARRRPRWVEYESVDALVANPKNPKAHDYDGLAESMDRFGYVDAVVVDDRTGLLVSGHGRVEYLRGRRAAGEDPPAGVTVAADGEWLVPVQHGWESSDDAEALAAVVALNRHVESGGWELEPLSAALALVSDAAGLNGTGFTEVDLGLLLDELAASGNGSDDPVHHVEFEAKDRTAKSETIVCPSCGAEWLRQDSHRLRLAQPVEGGDGD